MFNRDLSVMLRDLDSNSRLQRDKHDNILFTPLSGARRDVSYFIPPNYYHLSVMLRDLDSPSVKIFAGTS